MSRVDIIFGPTHSLKTQWQLENQNQHREEKGENQPKPKNKQITAVSESGVFDREKWKEKRQ